MAILTETGHMGSRIMRLTCLVFIVSSTLFQGCQQSRQSTIKGSLGASEYDRLMALAIEDFDQSEAGFRQYSDDYLLVSQLIPEYIDQNNLKPEFARNLRWHLGQIHAFNEDYEKAISEMKKAYAGGSVTWLCYVDGTIAFLERDKKGLDEALRLLRRQDNWMNIEVLESLVRHFEKPYMEAYNLTWQ